MTSGRTPAARERTAGTCPARALITSGLVAIALATLATLATPAGAQSTTVSIEGAAPGVSGTLLRRALNGPHATWVIIPGMPPLVPRDTSFPQSLVIVGGSARFQASVRGDVIVAGGDLMLGPGARIEGRAIAIGGRVMTSPWAFVRDSSYSFPRHGYDLRDRGERKVLQYSRQSEVLDRFWFELPAFYGLRELSYDRVESLGVQWGPDWVLAGTQVQLSTVIGWHAQLGALDPALHLRVPFAAAWAVDLDARRETRTNEAWISSTLDNTASALLFGTDVRNYYRAWRAEALVSRPIEFWRGLMTLRLGAAVERARALVTPDPPLFSVVRQTKQLGLRRPNPAVVPGDIASAIGEMRLDYATGVPLSLSARAEVPWQTIGAAKWAQVVIDGSILVPTVDRQYWRANGHGVVTMGGQAPPQRWHAVGGPGTLTTRDVLDKSGDQLAYAEQLYTFPIRRWDDPLWGTPKFSLRHVIGSAGVGSLGKIANEIGLRFDFAVLRTEFMYDPVSGRSLLSFAAAIGP